MGIPVVGTITMQDPNLNGDHEMSIGDRYNTDSRDSASLYVGTTQASFKQHVVILNDAEAGGLRLQVMENRSGNAVTTDGWCALLIR